MQYEEVRNVALEILQSLDGRFTTAYQICLKIEQRNPTLWSRLINEYKSEPGHPAMGEGAGIYYSPATFIAKSLDYFHTHKQKHLIKAYFESTDVNFAGFDPGYKGGYLSIWAWQ